MPYLQKRRNYRKKSRRGTIFWACNNYPECKFALSGKPTGEKCPLCKSLIIEDPKTGKKKCSNKECDYQENKLLTLA